MIPLIISADDYAQSAAIDGAILALIQQGRLTATSCLTLSPRWAEAAKLITSKIRSQADIGLHLDFTQYEQAARYSLPMLITRAICRSLPIKAIHASIHTQLDRFEDALGTAPDYIDGHQHVHQLPQIRDALLDIITHRYASQPPWLRVARPPLQDGVKAGIIGLLGASALHAKARKAGLRCSGALLGVYGFSGDAASYHQKLSAWLQAAQSKPDTGVFALMCHPAMATQSNLVTDDPIYAARLHEYQVMASPDFISLLAQYGVQPTRGDVLQMSAKK